MFGDVTQPVGLRKIVETDMERFNTANHWMTGNIAYIGRGSPLGNPYSSKPSKFDVTYVEDSEEAVTRFESDLYGRRLPPYAYEAMGQLILQSKDNPITLLCWCKDLEKCHGKVIRDYILNKGKKDVQG